MPSGHGSCQAGSTEPFSLTWVNFFDGSGGAESNRGKSFLKLGFTRSHNKERKLQFAGLAPGPFAGLILADNGASVIRVDRPSSTSVDVLCRGKRSIVIDSKITSGRKLLEEMITSADILIDPFRPGVLERLGLGPGIFLGDGNRNGLNERLIYARIVGYGDFNPVTLRYSFIGYVYSFPRTGICMRQFEYIADLLVSVMVRAS